MNREAASIEAAPSAAPANPRGRTGSLTRRMIGIAAIWIGALLLIGGFALDRLSLLVSQPTVERREPVGAAQLVERLMAGGEPGQRLAQVSLVERGQIQLRHPRPQTADAGAV